MHWNKMYPNENFCFNVTIWNTFWVATLMHSSIQNLSLIVYQLDTAAVSMLGWKEASQQTKTNWTTTTKICLFCYDVIKFCVFFYFFILSSRDIFLHSHIKIPNYCYQKESAEQGCLWAKDSFMELISSIRHKNIYDVIKLVKTEGVFSAVQVLFGLRLLSWPWNSLKLYM